MNSFSITIIIISALLAIIGFLWRMSADKKIAKLGEKAKIKKLYRSKMFATVIVIISLWFFSLQLVSALFNLPQGFSTGISIFSERVNILGLNLSNTIVVTWIAIGILLVAALIVRVFVISRMKKSPSGVQSMLEATVEGKKKVFRRESAGDGLRTYIFTAVILIITYLAIELFGVKTPIADISLIAASILTGLLILVITGIRLFFVAFARKKKERDIVKITPEEKREERNVKRAQRQQEKQQQKELKAAVVESKPHKRLNLVKQVITTVVIIAVWFFVVRILEIIFGAPAGQIFSFTLWPERVNIFGINLSNTIVVTWLAMAVILFISLLFRIFAAAQAARKPKGIQNALEAVVGNDNKRNESKIKTVSERLRSYVFTAIILLIAYTAIEMAGLTKLTADITLIITLIVVGVLAYIGLTIRIKNLEKREKRMLESELGAETDEKEREKQNRKNKTIKKLIITAIVASVWFFLVRLLELIFGKSQNEALKVSVWAERVHIFGLNLSDTIIISWVAMILLIIVALIVRIFVLKRMKDIPRGTQNVVETMVEGIAKYTSSVAGNVGENLGAYIFAVAALLVTSAIVELFGFRAPTADIMLTFALSINTFILINYYGIKEKGVFGRMKSLAAPTPFVLPFKLMGEIAIPISMSARLFGNMFGGLIVMDLLYSALGGSAIGIPSVIGLYFNVFHPLIQAFIFITLTLTFINEAAE